MKRPPRQSPLWPWLAVLLVVVLGAPAAWWGFAGGDETVEADVEVPRATGLRDGPDVLGRTAEEPQTTTTVGMTFGTQTTVPDVVGQNEATATFTVEEGGFRVRVTNRTVSSRSEEGVVVQQLPRGGATRRTGTTVTLVVGTLS
jgi:hypothetical protein